MLTTEEIKRAIDEFRPDGFEIRENVTDYLYCGNRLVCDLSENIIHVHEYYDLFLDRIIQGMNRETGFNIVQQASCVDVWNKNNGEEPLLQLINNCSTEWIREAREKVVRFVLKEGV